MFIINTGVHVPPVVGDGDMGIIDTVRESLLGDTAERHYSYRCNVCQATFESSEPTAATVGCPHCGAANVREISSEADR